MKFLPIIAAVGLFAFGAPAANAAGCLSGAAVGGVAGHAAGHHGVLGAMAGCAVGHHMARRDAQRAQQTQGNNYQGGNSNYNR